MIVNMNEIPIERNNNIEETLPSYEPDPQPTPKWHDYTAEQFVNLINSTYDDIIHWRKNLFELPNGKLVVFLLMNYLFGLTIITEVQILNA